jgi:hypothetical protein
MSAFESDAVWEAVTRFCFPTNRQSVQPSPTRIDPVPTASRLLLLDGHNHGHNLQPTPAYGGLLNGTTVGHTACSALLQPI